MMIELIGVTKRYSNQTVINQVDLQVARHTTTVLIGPSGSGKSTLLKMIPGLLLPDSGSVIVDGQPLTAANVLAMRRRIGYVIQSGGLFPHLTAARNIDLTARYLGWSATRIANRIRELAELSRFPLDGLDRYPSRLSGGQRQRIGLMRALMLDPDVLLLDEPLGSLDPLVRSELQQDLRDVFRTLKKTVLLVTHDLHEAAYFADQIVLLRNGEIVQRGTCRQLVQNPASEFVSMFVQAQRQTALEDVT